MENCYYKIHYKTFDISSTNFLVEIEKMSWTRKLISCLEFHLHSDCPLKTGGKLHIAQKQDIRNKKYPL